MERDENARDAHYPAWARRSATRDDRRPATAGRRHGTFSPLPQGEGPGVRPLFAHSRTDAATMP